MAKHKVTKAIYVYADWVELGGPRLMGTLQASVVRGKEVRVVSFDWREK